MRLGGDERSVEIVYPIIQAPMAGVSTPELAAAVSNAGGLGSIGIGASSLAEAREAIGRTRALTDHPFNVNVFAHEDEAGSEASDIRWAERLAPFFAAHGGEAPQRLRRIYASSQNDPALLSLLCETRPGIVSFHFGCPSPKAVTALKASGAVLLATATSLDEARILRRAGIDAIVAQGFEAGGHRGVFLENGPDERLGTDALTRRLVAEGIGPVIAAGGLMDGAAIARVCALGAIGAQLGTAFLTCPESAASPAYRTRLLNAGADETVMTRVISGRPARALRSAFTRTLREHEGEAPAYPYAYDSYKQLAALAARAGDPAYTALWAGTGAHRSRALPARDLLERLMQERDAAREG